MDEFDIYTLGAGFYLEKVFNAIVMILNDKGGMKNAIKLAAYGAITALSIKAAFTSNLKDTAKWVAGVTVLTSVFLTTKATVHIHDRLVDGQGMIAAPRTVQNVPWGLALTGSVTTQVGKIISEKFDTAFAAVFVNETYSKTGLMFGTKLIEETSNLRLSNPNAKQLLYTFYKQCIVPDANMGYSRKNGYTISDLASSEDILEFLKDHASKVRLINFSGFPNESSTTNQEERKVSGYISCNKAAHYLSRMIDQEINIKESNMATNFISYFSPDNKNTIDKNRVFEALLTDSYSQFIKSSKDAKDLLVQNVMINSLKDSTGSISSAFGKTTTEQMTASSFYSVSQVAQKFVPIFRAVLECLFYGVAPMVIILMVTPIGIDVLKNYAFSFVYLQLWLPMYSILYAITCAWGKYSAAGIKGLTYITQEQIASVNNEISMVAGYMLALVPILSMFITRGLVSSIGNLATSIFHIPQSAAIQASDQAIKGNYSFGNTSIDTHSHNNLNANKLDDNVAVLSGMQRMSTATGVSTTSTPTGQNYMDASSAVNNLGGMMNINFSKMMSSQLSQSESSLMQAADRHGSDYVQSMSSGLNKLLGYSSDKQYSEASSNNWQDSLSAGERRSLDELDQNATRYAEMHNISKSDAISIGLNGGLGAGLNLGLGSSVSGSPSASAGASLNANLGFNASGTKSARLNSTNEQGDYLSHEDSLRSSIEKATNIIRSHSFDTRGSESNNTFNSIKSDFNKAEQAATNRAKAFEELQQIQTQKINLESNSHSIQQNLEHQFADWGQNRFGADQFINLMKNPSKQQDLAKEFMSTTNLTVPSHDLQKEEYFKKEQLFNMHAQNNMDQMTMENRYIKNGEEIPKNIQTLDNKNIPGVFDQKISKTQEKINNTEIDKATKTNTNNNLNKSLFKKIIE